MQLVLRASGKGRVLAAEVLIATRVARARARDARVYRVAPPMGTGVNDGARTMDQSLLLRAERGLISDEQAIGRSPDPDARQPRMEAIVRRPANRTAVAVR